MKVKLIAHTPNPDMVCAAAAYTSWKKKGMEDLYKELPRDEALNFLRKVMGFGHESVTEHANFTYGVEGISRACSHELVRHRLASYTQQSQRYVKFGEEEVGYVTPESIKKSKFKVHYYGMMYDIAKFYQEMLSEGIKPEDARFVLPNAAKTNIVVTMNARELNHFFDLRCCERAQWEIRELANKMLEQAKEVAPVLFEKAGAQCIRLEYCPEGELTCGKYPTREQVIQAYKTKEKTGPSLMIGT